MPNARPHPVDRRFRFFEWNELHVRAPHLLGNYRTFPFANEKALWAVTCAQGKNCIDKPDLIVSAGDFINGEIPDLGEDLSYLKSAILEPVKVPVLPCLGNHEVDVNFTEPHYATAYDKFYGPHFHNYVYTFGGIGFIVADTAETFPNDHPITRSRDAFVKRAFERLDGMPIIFVTHIPIIPMRDPEKISISFGYKPWIVDDPRLVRNVERHADRVIAVLCGHLHLTSVRQQNGIYHIMPGGIAGYPSDFASFDVFPDRIDMEMHRGPEEFLDDSANIHGPKRHKMEFVDAEHPDNQSYIWGLPSERKLTIPLEGAKRPSETAACKLEVFIEPTPGSWQATEAPGC